MIDEEKRHDIRYHVQQYFTLEASYEDKWAVCSRDTSMHSCHGFWDSPDKDSFVEWVKDRING